MQDAIQVINIIKTKMIEVDLIIVFFIVFSSFYSCILYILSCLSRYLLVGKLCFFVIFNIHKGNLNHTLESNCFVFRNMDKLVSY